MGSTDEAAKRILSPITAHRQPNKLLKAALNNRFFCRSGGLWRGLGLVFYFFRALFGVLGCAVGNLLGPFFDFVAGFLGCLAGGVGCVLGVLFNPAVALLGKDAQREQAHHDHGEKNFDSHSITSVSQSDSSGTV